MSNRYRSLAQMVSGRISAVVLLTFMFFSTVSVGQQQSDSLRVDQPSTGKLSNWNRYDIDYRIMVTAPYKTKVLKVWLPLPQTDRMQAIDSMSFSTFPQYVTPEINREKTHGNKFAYFEFKNPKGAQVISLKFRARLAQVDWGVDLAKIRPVDKWPKSFDPFLKNEFDSNAQKQFDSVLGKILPEKKGTAVDVEAVIDWTNQNLTYSHSNASLKADAVHALDQREGHCSDYHGLCSALGRKLGYPARVTYGISMFEKASPSHCKLEIFMPPHGWVAFDVSETQKLIKSVESNDELSQADKASLVKAARKRLLAGFRDNTWLQVTRGTNFELVPAAKAKTVPLVRTIYAEADGKPLEEPDPSNSSHTKFSWMTAVKINRDRDVSYPFKDFGSLKPFVEPDEKK